MRSLFVFNKHNKQILDLYFDLIPIIFFLLFIRLSDLFKD